MTTPARASEDPALRQELARLRGVVEHLPGLVSFWDTEMRNELANAGHLEWFGHTPEQMHGKLVREVVGDAIFEEHREHITAALAGQEQRFEASLVTSGGTTRHAQVSCVPEMVDGRVVGFFAFINDVTAQMNAQRELAQAQAMAHLGSYTVRPATEEIRWSPELFRITGKDPATYVPTATSYIRMVHPEDLPRILAVRDQAAQGIGYEASYRIILDDGEERHVHAKTQSVLDAEGNVVLLRGIMQDQTEEQRTARRLESANGLLSDLIGMLGHDLRQPVSIVLGYLETLSEDWDTLPEPDRAGYARTSLRAAHRMDALLRDILTLVNLDTATLAHRPVELDAAAVVREVLAQNEVEVSCTVDDLRVVADEVQLRQMLSNLLTNAERYGRAPVLLDVHRDGEEVVFCVRDHGDGVPADFVSRLFERFTRADSGVAARTTGTGFGLYIVKRLAVTNGGDITYTPTVPHGATFCLRLPLAT